VTKLPQTKTRRSFPVVAASSTRARSCAFHCRHPVGSASAPPNSRLRVGQALSSANPAGLAGRPTGRPACPTFHSHSYRELARTHQC
jgi:hypothetical protein